MKSIKMSYRGFCFEVNPKTVKVEFKRAQSTAVIPRHRARTEEICELPAVISGTGRLYGSDARAKMQGFLSAYKKGGAAYLFSPVFPPVKAYFTSLTFSVNAEEDCIEYAFSFKEAESKKRGSFDFGYTLAEDGENLFDIAYRTGVSIEKIIALNGFEDPFSVTEGEKVWLK